MYLITGSAGFLGRHVVNQVFQNGCVGIDNFDPICGADTRYPARPSIYCDVTDFEALKKIVLNHRPEVIIHLAAYGRNLSCQHFAHRAWNVNVNGTLNVLELARLYPNIVKRVVCASSNITLSDQPTVYKDTKLAVESLVKLYSTLGVSTMALRPSNIYGDGQSRTEYQPCAFAGLDMYYEKFGDFKITGDGTQSRDWTNVEDVARAFVLASFSNVSGPSVDICTGVQASMNEIAALLGVPVVYTDARPGDAKTLVSDPIPAREMLGFEAKVKLADAIYSAFPSVKR